jgi:hypothetical protein
MLSPLTLSKKPSLIFFTMSQATGITSSMFSAARMGVPAATVPISGRLTTFPEEANSSMILMLLAVDSRLIYPFA